MDVATVGLLTDSQLRELGLASMGEIASHGRKLVVHINPLAPIKAEWILVKNYSDISDQELEDMLTNLISLDYYLIYFRSFSHTHHPFSM